MNCSNVFSHGGQAFEVDVPQFADLQAVVFDLCHIAVERPRRGTREHLAVDRKFGAVAGAHELACFHFPMVGAGEVRALRPECDNLCWSAP